MLKTLPKGWSKLAGFLLCFCFTPMCVYYYTSYGGTSLRFSFLTNFSSRENHSEFPSSRKINISKVNGRLHQAMNETRIGTEKPKSTSAMNEASNRFEKPNSTSANGIVHRAMNESPNGFENHNNTSAMTKTVIGFEKKLKESLKNAQEEEYIILVWETAYGKKGKRKTASEKCGRCHVTYDKSTVSNPLTKALFFHFDEVRLNKMPKNRRSDQLYVWWNRESPSNLRISRGMQLKEFDWVFNLTFTYKRDSDVYFPYSSASDVLRKLQAKGSGDPVKDLEEVIQKKTGLALWVVSNCEHSEGAKTRMNLSNNLIKAGLRLDRGGRCFPGNPIKSIEVAKSFKFYMSFENSFHCNDYITEKFFRNGLMLGAVPVVWGAKKSDYEAVAPPGSFIFVEDFDTPAKLVEYLNYLDKNDTAYKEYFRWRTMKVEDMPQYKRTGSFCQICRILHGINVDNIYNPRYEESYSNIPMFGFPDQPRVVPSLRNFFYEQEDRNCLPKY